MTTNTHITLLLFTLLIPLTTSTSTPSPPSPHFHSLNDLESLTSTKLTPPKQTHPSQPQPQQKLSLKLFHRDTITPSTPTTTHKTRFTARLKRDTTRASFLLRRFNKQEYAFGSDVVSGSEEGSGEYFVRIGIGSPPVYQYMVIDSGSDVMWVQCQPCDQCYNQSDPIFNPALSASFIGVSCESAVCEQLDDGDCRQGRCGYQIAYGDGSYTKGTNSELGVANKSICPPSIQSTNNCVHPIHPLQDKIVNGLSPIHPYKLMDGYHPSTTFSNPLD